MSTKESRALGVVCPRCRAGVGRPCLSQASKARLAMKHPHRERLAKERVAWGDMRRLSDVRLVSWGPDYDSPYGGN